MNPFESIKRAIRSMVSLAVVLVSKNRSAEVSMAAGEKHSDMRVALPYGVAARCPKGKTCLVLFNGDSHSSGSVVGYFDDSSPNVEDGEVCFYSVYGQKILLKKDGSVRAIPKSGMPFMCSGDIEIAGELRVVGELYTRCVNVNDRISAIPGSSVSLGGHVHECTTPGSPSGPAVG